MNPVLRAWLHPVMLLCLASLATMVLAVLVGIGVVSPAIGRPLVTASSVGLIGWNGWNVWHRKLWRRPRRPS